MMKSWADHCSSDEESLDDVQESFQDQTLNDPPPPTPQVVHTTTEDQQHPEDGADEQHPEGAGDDDAGPPPAPQERVYDFPDKPPFTAFVGNLAYSVKEGEDLKQAVTDVARERLGAEIHVIGGRIGVDRKDGRHRGFGYVEVETLDELKLLMQLNDGQAMIAGRKIQFDTANQAPQHHHNNRRGSDRRQHHDHHHRASGEIDGSKFRGGLRNNRRSAGGPPSGISSDRPVGERPSLKLAPRSKPREGDDKDKGASANIFGGAKARDEQAWEKRRLSAKSNEHGNNNNKKDGGGGNQHDRRGSGRGRGGAGGGRSGRSGGGGGRGRGDNNHQKKDASKANNKKSPQKQQSPEEKAAAAAAAAQKATPEPAPVPAPKKAPENKFALLMDSDSD